MSEELRPCPFCGGGAYITELKTISGKTTFDIFCENMECVASSDRLSCIFWKRYYNKNEVIKAWNRRADDE